MKSWNRLRIRWFMLTALFAALPLTASTADLGRGVARISLLQGDVSVRRGDTGEWIAAAVNAPLVTQDYVFTGTGSRAEVQFDWANFLRLASDSEVRLADLQDQRYLVQIARGLVTLSVVRDSRAEIEVSTPSISVRPTRKGTYRIAVLPEGVVQITVRSGEAEVFSPSGVERLSSGKTMLVRGEAKSPDYQLVKAIARDDWDLWNQDRNSQILRSQSYRYVSRDIYGAEDLDGYGRWVNIPPYGWTWSPYVAAGWAPYRYGRWAWMDYWGWSWVSYDPWGWAPYHYGRWFYSAPYGWCWHPGGIWGNYTWSPGLVAFFGWGTGGFRAGLGIGWGWGNVGWVPLAPYEPFYPWWGHGYGRGNVVYNNVNIVNNTNITNIYRNSRIGNAVTAVGGEDFARGEYNNLQRVSPDQIRRVNVARGAFPVAPEREALRMAAWDVNPANIPRSAEGARFYSRTEPRQVERAPFERTREEMVRISRATMPEERGASGNLSRVDSADGGRTRGGEAVSAREGQSVRAGGAEGRGAAGDVSRGAGGNLARGEAATGNAGPAADSRTWRRVGGAGTDTQAAGETAGSVRSGAPADANRDSGWRRVGETAPIGRDTSATGDSLNRVNPGSRVDRIDSTPRTAEPIGRGGSGESRDGWRRFGEPLPRTESVSPMERSDRYGGRSAINDIERNNRGASPATGESGTAEGNWRGFGQPIPRTDRSGGPDGGASDPGAGSPRTPAQDGGRWQRFEGSPRDPGGAASPGVERNDTPRSEPRSFDRGMDRYSSPGMDRGGSSGMDRSPSSRSDSPRWDRGGESIRINPPIVRERSAPSWEGSRGGGMPSMDRGRMPSMDRGGMPSMDRGGSMPRMDRGGMSGMGGGGSSMPRGGGGDGGGGASRGGGGGGASRGGGGGGRR